MSIYCHRRRSEIHCEKKQSVGEHGECGPDFMIHKGNNKWCAWVGRKRSLERSTVYDTPTSSLWLFFQGMKKRGEEGAREGIYVHIYYTKKHSFYSQK